MSMSSDPLMGMMKRPHGGVEVSHHKSTKDLAIVTMPPPQTVQLPLKQHVGVPCEPVVSVGDEVKLGQVIADSDAALSVPIHASVSGKVSKITDISTVNGLNTRVIEITSDRKMEWHESIVPPRINNLEEFLTEIRASGLVGLGGAGFPAFFKLDIPQHAEVDTLIINAAECEPFITVDYRTSMEQTEDIVLAVNALCEYLRIKEVIIAIEDNKSEAIDKFVKLIEERKPGKKRVRVASLPSTYPQGAEKVMIYAVTGRIVEAGKLPADAGCLLMNVSSVAFIGQFLRTGQPLVERSLTVDGSAIQNPKNVRLPIGTSVRDLIKFCGGFRETPYKVVMGGPMMGIALDSIDQPILKQNNAILALTPQDLEVAKVETDCIRCGRCLGACPMYLNPTMTMRAAQKEDVDRLNELEAMLCMECGSCAYECPAAIPLVQYMRLAKAQIRKAAQ